MKNTLVKREEKASSLKK